LFPSHRYEVEQQREETAKALREVVAEVWGTPIECLTEFQQNELLKIEAEIESTHKELARSNLSMLEKNGLYEHFHATVTRLPATINVPTTVGEVALTVAVPSARLIHDGEKAVKTLIKTITAALKINS
jgi:hypothetical protein